MLSQPSCSFWSLLCAVGLLCSNSVFVLLQEQCSRPLHSAESANVSILFDSLCRQGYVDTLPMVVEWREDTAPGTEEQALDGEAFICEGNHRYVGVMCIAFSLF